LRKRLNYFKYSVGLLVLQKNIVLLLITVTAIFSSLLGPALSFDFAFATSEEEEEGEGEGEDNDDGGDDDRGCDLSYPEDCIPSPPPDLDCGDNGVPNNIKVLPPDPHRLDGNKDGIGCEGSSRGGGGGGGSSGDGDNGNNDGGNNDGGSASTDECQGQADCFRGTVTEIVDGDTMDINNLRVRLALVNTPERGESGYTKAIDFVESVCGVGTTALVDEDDGQKEGSFDRLIGLIYCGDDGINNKKSLNELLVEHGYAVIYQDFCNISEFSSASWVQRHGC
jgi:Staphylococcal nuclease homologue